MRREWEHTQQQAGGNAAQRVDFLANLNERIVTKMGEEMAVRVQKYIFVQKYIVVCKCK
jgi:hypothetical protein